MKVIIYLLLILSFVKYDSFLIKIKGKSPNKKLGWTIRFLISSAYAIAWYGFSIYAVRFALFIGAIFYLIFDYALNIICKKPFFHKNDGPIDRLIPEGLPDLSFKIIFFFTGLTIWQYDFFDCMRIGIFDRGFIDFFRSCSSLLI